MSESSQNSATSQGPNIQDLTLVIEKVKNTVSEISKLGGIFTKTIGESAEYVGKTLSNWQEMTSFGIADKNLFQLAQSAVDARMTMSQFANTMKEHALAISAIGETMTAGSSEFVKASQRMYTLTVKEGKTLSDNLQMLGYTNNELNDLLMSQIESLTNLTTAERIKTLNDTKFYEGLTKYGVELDLMAKLTGVNRKDLVREQQERQRLPAFNARVASTAQETGMSELEIGQRFSLATAGQGEAIKKMMSEMFTNNGNLISEESRRTAAILGTNVIKQMQETVASVSNQNLEMGDITKSNTDLQKAITGLRDVYRTTGVAFNPSMQELLTPFYAQTYDQKNMDVDAARAEQKQALENPMVAELFKLINLTYTGAQGAQQVLTNNAERFINYALETAKKYFNENFGDQALITKMLKDNLTAQYFKDFNTNRTDEEKTKLSDEYKRALERVYGTETIAKTSIDTVLKALNTMSMMVPDSEATPLTPNEKPSSIVDVITKTFTSFFKGETIKVNVTNIGDLANRTASLTNPTNENVAAVQIPNADLLATHQVDRSVSTLTAQLKNVTTILGTRDFSPTQNVSYTTTVAAEPQMSTDFLDLQKAFFVSMLSEFTTIGERTTNRGEPAPSPTNTLVRPEIPVVSLGIDNPVEYEQSELQLFTKSVGAAALSVMMFGYQTSNATEKLHLLEVNPVNITPVPVTVTVAKTEQPTQTQQVGRTAQVTDTDPTTRDKVRTESDITSSSNKYYTASLSLQELLINKLDLLNTSMGDLLHEQGRIASDFKTAASLSGKFA